ncbi:cysteine hydrolase family protein [Streptomyces sp. NBC_01602]|uniref:cysteine hydrolase family protein n=1 Tax=Streptomyces sp. NBC_01602 TaxID=2975893 RepID=UPI0038685C88|nr:cysteine hydrolase [Streptomyces sp. NBC_01602]
MNTRPYPADHTALILVDLLNDFFADDGKLNGLIAPMLKEMDLTARLAHLIEKSRERGVRIFYSPHGIDEHSFDDVTSLLPVFQGALDNQVFWKGSYGGDFYQPLRPRDGETVISHHRMFDSFVGTDLDQKLKAHGIERVVLAGLTAHTCVEGTGRHALEAGYHVTYLTDAVAEFTEAAQRAAVDLSYPTFGHAVSTIDEFLAGIEPAATA